MNFDRVAHLYDGTRGFPPGVDDAVADGIIHAVHPTGATQFLEIGAGTGRIGLPLLRRGIPYTGIDISSQMLARFAEKAPEQADLTLVEGDITALPFPAASFDVVLAVHILHLVAEWRTALEEVRRVLTPGGAFVLGSDAAVDEAGPARAIRRQWREWVVEAGGVLRPGNGSREAVEAWLVDADAYSAEYTVTRWTRSLRPIDLLEALRDNTFSQSWGVDPAILTAVHNRLVPWARERFGDIEAPVSSEHEFTILVSRFVA